jgi:phosphoglycerate kinase
MTNFKTINDIDVFGKRVFVRLDLNVPMKDGIITDTTRIDRSLETLKRLSEKGAKVIAASHYGRPKGNVVDDMSLHPIALALGRALGRDVPFAANCVGPAAEQTISRMENGDIVVLENLRFHVGEEKNDPGFAKQLADLADLFVNDAFSTAHRAHASTEGITHYLESAAGYLMQAELNALSNALVAPQHPMAALVGGAKISTKMDVLGNLVSRADVVIIGGGMANTFLYAQGVDVGNSLCEKDMADQARDIMTTAAEAGCEIVLPLDAVIAKEFAENAANETVTLDAVPSDAMILDVGPASINDVVERLGNCKTIVWNGPMGAFEISPFDVGTNAVAREVARLTKAGSMLSVAGGGDTVAALANAGVVDIFSYVSTAGGAFLEWLEGKELPGVAALGKK